MLRRMKFDESQELWQKLYLKQSLKGPFFQYRWHEVWYDTLGKDYAPLVLVYKDEVLIPLAFRDGEVIFSGGDETTDYNDAIGNEELKLEAWKECFNYLKHLDVVSIDLRNIPEGMSVEYFSTLEVSVEKEDITPLFVLPQNWDEYLASLKRKWRKELKRKIKNFERDNVNVTYDHDGKIDCLISLMRKNQEKVEFLNRSGMEEYFRKIYEVFSDQARIECLSVNGDLVASIYYFVTEDSYLLYNSGFDKKNYDSAGFYIKAMNIKKAMDEKVKTYNFLQGSERYKYEMGGEDFFVYRMRLEF